MLETVLGTIGSTGLGAALGLLGGIFNRFFDYRTRTLDIEIRRLDNAQALAMRDKDMEQTQLEQEGQLRLATIEQERAKEDVAYQALAASYRSDTATYGGGWTDTVRGIIRPLVTAWFMFVTCATVGSILYIGFYVYQVSFSAEQMHHLVLHCVEWVLFQGSVVIGWWFAVRPSDYPKVKQ